MTDQNTYAIYAMCAIVITLYALKNDHAHFLPDLFGLALALAAPRQSLAIGAVIIAALIRHTGIAYGLADYLPDWLLPVVLPGARYMSIQEQEAQRLEEAYRSRIFNEESDDGNTEIQRRVAENEDQIISSAQVVFAAKAILSGAMDKTEATRIASGVRSGRKYSQYARLIKAEIERQQTHYPDLDQAKKQIPKKTKK
jgi:hypothetical protein